MPEAPKPFTAQEQELKSIRTKVEQKTKRLTSEFSPKTIEGTFTVEKYSKFSPSDLTNADRAYVRTESGNIYRLDRSRSRNRYVKFHNEKTGQLNYAQPAGSNSFIEVGKSMKYRAVDDPDNPKQFQLQNSPVVKEIEVWRNYLNALDEVEAELKNIQAQNTSFGGELASVLKNQAGGAIQNRDYTKK